MSFQLVARGSRASCLGRTELRERPLAGNTREAGHTIDPCAYGLRPSMLKYTLDFWHLIP